MGTSTVQTVDVTAELARLLESVDSVRVYPYVSDAVRVPAVVIGQPTLDFADQDAAFCTATWMFPLNVITSRSNERASQSSMSQLLLDIVTALGADVDGIFSIEPQDARPLIGVTVNGQEFPAYLLNVRIRA